MQRLPILANLFHKARMDKTPAPSPLEMRFALFEAMALTLWRDRASFALTFLLPPLIYVIFAAVFSAASSGDLSIRLGVTSPSDDITKEIILGLEQSDLISDLSRYATTTHLSDAVAGGQIDAAIEILRPDESEPPQFRIYFDPVKQGAASIAEAALAAQQPDGDEDEDEEIETIQPAEFISISGNGAVSMASYYAAGVGMLFIFLSGFQSALTVIEERDNGVVERIAAGPFGIKPMIDGKFAFLVLQGMAQLAIIFLVAFVLFQIPLGIAPFALLMTIFAAAFCASGLCLAIVGCCHTRSQAHAIGAVLALVMAALGGSMAPRFLMAPEIRAIGAFTPNAWGIEAFGVSLWRDGNIEAAIIPWCLLLGTGLAGLMISWVVMQRTLRS